MALKQLTNLAALVCLACAGCTLSADAMTDAWNGHVVLVGNASLNTILVTIHMHLPMVNVFEFKGMDHQIEEDLRVVVPHSIDDKAYASIAVGGFIDYITVDESTNGEIQTYRFPEVYKAVRMPNVGDVQMPQMYTPSPRWIYAPPDYLGLVAPAKLTPYPTAK